MKPVTLLVIGAGSRGTGYAGFAAEHPERAKVVGVAEPREAYRSRLAETHGIPPENVFADWRQAAGRERFADAVLICTPDALHAGAAETLESHLIVFAAERARRRGTVEDVPAA